MVHHPLIKVTNQMVHYSTKQKNHLNHNSHVKINKIAFLMLVNFEQFFIKFLSQLNLIFYQQFPCCKLCYHHHLNHEQKTHHCMQQACTFVATIFFFFFLHIFYIAIHITIICSQPQLLAHACYHQFTIITCSLPHHCNKFLVLFFFLI